MYDNIKNYIEENDFLISFSNSKVHIYNYLNIDLVSEKLIEIKFKDQMVIIKGKDFYIKQLDKKEILITGNVTHVDFR